jgi:hypothetical protein
MTTVIRSPRHETNWIKFTRVQTLWNAMWKDSLLCCLKLKLGGELSGGEKIHRFRKGLRDELKKVAVLDPTTGAPYQDIDALISALTKYDAAVGGTAQGKRQRLGGGPSVAVTTVDHAYPTAKPDGTWTGHARKGLDIIGRGINNGVRLGLGTPD